MPSRFQVIYDIDEDSGFIPTITVLLHGKKVGLVQQLDVQASLSQDQARVWMELADISHWNDDPKEAAKQEDTVRLLLKIPGVHAHIRKKA